VSDEHRDEFASPGPSPTQPKPSTPLSELSPPRPMPEPLPLIEVRSAIQPSARIVIALAIALAVVLTVLGFAFIVYSGVRGGLPFDPLAGIDGRPDRLRDVWWAGSGDYVVANVGALGEKPVVLVWNRRTEQLREIAGFRVMYVEPDGSRAWVTPLAKVRESDVSPPESGDVRDRTLLVLPLASGDPAPPKSLEWTWPNGRGTSARFIVDPSKGSHPCAASFVSRAGKTVDVHVQREISSTYTTFEPIGWSPSGKYFAFRPIPKPEYEGSPPAIIVSASDGSFVDDFAVSEPIEPSARSFAWDPRRDVLYALEQRDDDSETYTITYLDPGYEWDWDDGDAFHDHLLRSNESLESADEVELLGATDDGIAVAVYGDDGYETWRLSKRAPSKAGDVGEMDPGVWDRRGGYASFDLPDDAWVLRVSGLDGSHAKTIWTEVTSR